MTDESTEDRAVRPTAGRGKDLSDRRGSELSDQTVEDVVAELKGQAGLTGDDRPAKRDG